MHNMNTRESAVVIAMTFQKAVERGEVENTDEAYISFATKQRTQVGITPDRRVAGRDYSYPAP